MIPPPDTTESAMSWAIVVLARAIEQLQAEVRLALDIQTVNERLIQDALAHLRTAIAERAP
jgi:hypothetical protein